MQRLEVSKPIKYWWKRDDGEDIKESHIDVLKESALNRIGDMIKDGYICGELCDNICMDDEDGEDGINYSGWWGEL